MRGGRGIRTPLSSQAAASWDRHIASDRDVLAVAADVHRCEVLDRIVCRGLPNSPSALIRATHPDRLETSAGADFSDKGSGDSSKSEELHGWLGYRIAEVCASLNRIWKIPFST